MSSVATRRLPTSPILGLATRVDGISRGNASAFLAGVADAAPATKLAITSVNSGANPTAASAFSVVIDAQSNNRHSGNGSSATGVSLSLKTWGHPHRPIAAGTSRLTLTGVTYTKAESGVSLTATRTSGNTLTAGNSATFTVNPGAAATLAVTTQPGSTTASAAIP